MKIIVTRHYPASNLPSDLREGIPTSALVTVIVEETDRRFEHARMREKIKAEVDELRKERED
jgi:hypothetical protein